MKGPCDCDCYGCKNGAHCGNPANSCCLYVHPPAKP